ncbi:hypothetical protein DQ239_14885 [Blastococcus sp. TF02-09]|uniref:hypothetical protein n=1 Tax=Blastococcus sp. TF02-09 TaxID=2250576 RepID=UPI000DE83844|nr:hypothetical protein [Blastococcus sp. TF02-9]RBY76264.1 hypothetical protein DQ239_14885 [Blastococcus sp. TF02-9]
MFAIIASGVLALAGTTLGSVLTYRHQSKLARQDREAKAAAEERQWERERDAEGQARFDRESDAWMETRRAAAETFLRLVAAHAEACRTYWVLLADKADAELEATRSTYLATWRDVFAEVTTFQLRATAALSEQGRELFDALIEYSDAVERVTTKTSQKAEAAQQRFYTARDQFVTSARSELLPATAAIGVPSR